MNTGYYSGEEALKVFGAFVSDDVYRFSKIFCLCDANTHKLCYPALVESGVSIHRCIVIGAGERHKDLHTLSVVWKDLLDAGADRNSILINLGGGVVTDLGGMAASTFMRGIRYVNMPTTLLAMVDASIGGKTGIDFGGAKNIAGTFSWPEITIAHFPFLDTLPDAEWKNGITEIIKHQLIGDAAGWEDTCAFFDTKPGFDSVKDHFRSLISASAAVKHRIVKQDPYEGGIRACLNFGHSIGHGIESWSLENNAEPVAHGEAVMAGMICETYLSVKHCNLSPKDAEAIINVADHLFPRRPFSREVRGHILEKIRFDKKKQDGTVKFALISAPGIPAVGVGLTSEHISEALHFYAS